MPAVQLSINHIPSDKRVYRVYPGRGRRFLEEFQENGIAFLEVPDSALEAADFTNTELVRRKVRRSRSIADMMRGRTERPSVLPSLGLFQGGPDSRDRSGNSLIGSVNMLYNKAKPGDLIISPGAGAYKEVLYGEITEPFSGTDLFELDRFGGMAVPVRRVNWIKKTSGEQLLPFDMAKFLMGRQAVSRLRKTDRVASFFDIAYSSYVYNGKSRLQLDAPGYNSDDFLATARLNSALGLLISAVEAQIEEGSLDLSSVNPDQIINQYLSEALLDYYRQNFNSPGNISFKAIRDNMGPVVAILVSLAIAGALVAVSTGAQLDVSSQEPLISGNECDAYSEIAKNMAQSLGSQKCQELQDQIQSASDALHLDVPAQATP